MPRAFTEYESQLMTVYDRRGEVQEDILVAIDEVVVHLLRSLHMVAPPVDALQILGRLGLELGAPRRGRRMAKGAAKGWCRWASQSGEQERQVAAAARIGGYLARSILSRLRFLEDCTAETKTRLAAPFAARLLMPTNWFREDVRSLGYELARLHARYCTASMEFIAWRLMDLGQPCVVTIFDNNHVVERRSNVSIGNRPPDLAPAERAAQAYAHHYSRPRIEHSPGVTARAWPLHRADWRREIVVARLDCESFEIADWAD